MGRTDVKNIKKYLLTMLFNAPVTLNGRTMLAQRCEDGEQYPRYTADWHICAPIRAYLSNRRFENMLL